MALRKKVRSASSSAERVIEVLEDAVEFEYGKSPAGRADGVTLTARVAEASPAPTYTGARIARARTTLRLSQAVFAMALNVSVETVRAWEQGKREPDGAALRLLQIVEQHPEWILETVRIREGVESGS